MKSTWKNILFLSTIIAASSVLIYMPTLKSGFIWDDLQLTASPFRMGRNVYSFFYGGGTYYRPFLHLSMAIDHSLWNLNPLGYHLTNVILQTLNSLLVFLTGFYFLKNRTLGLEAEGGEGNYFKNPLILSFAAAMLFALHPIHTESVAWISGRTDMLSTLFFLLAFLSYLIYEREGKGAALVLSSIFFLFSLFSKENAIAFIGVVFAYGFFTGMPRKKMALSLTALLFVTVVYFILRHGGGGGVSSGSGPDEAFFNPGITVKGFLNALSMGTGYYMEKLLLPFELNLVPSIPENPIFFLFFLLPFVLGGILYSKGRRLEAFLIAWIIITLFPSLLILFVQRTAAPLGERYLYLPSVGFAVLLPVMIVKMKTRIFPLILLFGIVAVFALSTNDRLKDWRDNLTLWADTVQKSPDSANAHINYGQALLEKGEINRAKEEFLPLLKGKKLSFQQKSTLLLLLGKSELNMGNYDKSREYLLLSLDSDPKNVLAYNILGVLHMTLSESADITAEKSREHLEQAIGYLQKAIDLAPKLTLPRFNMGLCYLKLDDLEKAKKCFYTVIELDPKGELSGQALQFLFVTELLKSKKTQDNSN